MGAVRVEALAPGDRPRVLTRLVALLRACVDAGAGVGFLRPLDEARAAAYWEGAFADLERGRRRLWVAWDGDDLVGTMQLARASWETGGHRGEVQKFLVAPGRRRAGVGSLLMATLEEAARKDGLTLLILDTFEGSEGDAFYRAHGWNLVGTIPDYAKRPNGELGALVLFWKRI